MFAVLVYVCLFAGAVALAIWLPWYVSTVLIIGLIGCEMWLRRAKSARVPVPVPVSNDVKGPSAWGREEPTHTPEGEPIRICGGGEIAMGGPVENDYLLPDGVLLQGLGSSACFSSDGRYFAAPIPSRQRWALAILDRHERRLYQSDFAGFWEIDSFTPETIRGRRSPLTANEPAEVSLQKLLDEATATDLVAVQDLWLMPNSLQRISNTTELTLPEPPAGPHRLTARRFMPASLRQLKSPLRVLNFPLYELQVDGRSSGLLIEEGTSVTWQPDGLALQCRASVFVPDTGDLTPGNYVWTPADGWQRSPSS